MQNYIVQTTSLAARTVAMHALHMHAWCHGYDCLEFLFGTSGTLSRFALFHSTILPLPSAAPIVASDPGRSVMGYLDSGEIGSSDTCE